MRRAPSPGGDPPERVALGGSLASRLGETLRVSALWDLVFRPGFGSWRGVEDAGEGRNSGAVLSSRSGS